jgi:hypothetical protein
LGGKVMPRMDKLSSYKTTIGSTADGIAVRYCSTDIVVFNDRTVTLNSGGWRTATTKRKMQQASNQFRLGFGIWQEDYCWYVSRYQGDKVPFEDGMTFPRGGH